MGSASHSEAGSRQSSSFNSSSNFRKILRLSTSLWINEQQHQVLEYLRTENQVLKEKLGRKRILLNDDLRRRLAVKGKALGRKLLDEIGTLFTPDTILRWHRELVARKWAHSEKRAMANERTKDCITRSCNRGRRSAR